MKLTIKELRQVIRETIEEVDRGDHELHDSFKMDQLKDEFDNHLVKLKQVSKKLPTKSMKDINDLDMYLSTLQGLSKKLVASGNDKVLAGINKSLGPWVTNPGSSLPAVNQALGKFVTKVTSHMNANA